jgi:hypothetical protein
MILSSILSELPKKNFTKRYFMKSVAPFKKPGIHL